MFFHRGSGDGGQKGIAMSTLHHHPANVNASTYHHPHSSMAGMQGERLHQIVVFELREDGNTQYHTMTLRSLYNYVVTTITEGCREANRKKQQQQNSLGADGWFFGGGADLLGKQALASVATLAFSFVVTYIVAVVINKTIGIRVSTEDELVGLDQSQHAETAYQA